LIADGPFLAVQRMMRKFFKQQLCNEILRLHIDLEFDVVGLGYIDAQGPLKILAQEISRGAGHFHSRVEIMRHDERLIEFGARAAK
jgi:hypothetical protein